MSDLDDLIRTDFSDLAAETARAVPAFSAVSAELAGAGGPYRDGEAGVEARRHALREARVAELALMPLAYERVFVHRVSRAAAGAAALGGVGVAVLASMDVWTQRIAYVLIGQPTAPLVAALLGATALAAYVVAGLLAERYYERRVGATTRAGDDAHADIDRLEGVGPTDEARRLVDSVDSAAVALPLAGLVAGGMTLGLLVFFSDHGYSALRLIVEGADVLIPASFVGVAAAFILGLACGNDRRGLDRSAVLRAAEHWTTLAIGIGAGIGSLWFAARSAFRMHAYGIVPDSSASMVLGALGLAALIMPTSWAILWLRRREWRRIGI